jgi:hypothetical protein
MGLLCVAAGSAPAAPMLLSSGAAIALGERGCGGRRQREGSGAAGMSIKGIDARRLPDLAGAETP